jgi:hypothetical protein
MLYSVHLELPSYITAISRFLLFLRSHMSWFPTRLFANRSLEIAFIADHMFRGTLSEFVYWVELVYKKWGQKFKKWGTEDYDEQKQRSVPDTNRGFMKKIIESIRFSFRRELRKVKKKYSTHDCLIENVVLVGYEASVAGILSYILCKSCTFGLYCTTESFHRQR